MGNLNVPSLVATWDADAQRIDAQNAQAENADRWVTGCNGYEIPMLDIRGRWVLYVWNPAMREHGWLDIADDIVSAA